MLIKIKFSNKNNSYQINSLFKMIDFLEQLLLSFLKFIKQFVSEFVPYFRYIALFIIVGFLFFILFYFFKNRILFYNTIKKDFSFKSMFFLVILIGICLFFILQITPQVRIHDEMTQLYEVRNLIDEKDIFMHSTNRYESLGWSILCVLPVMLFSSMKGIFYFNVLFSILSLVVFFIIIKTLTKNNFISFLISFLFYFHIGNLRVISSASQFVSFVFFLLVSFLFFLYWLKYTDLAFLFFSFLNLSFASFIRIEGYVIFLPFFIMYFVNKKKCDFKVFKYLLIIVLFLIPVVFLQLSAYLNFGYLGSEIDAFYGDHCVFHEEQGFFEGYNDIGFKNLIYNSKVFFPYVFNGSFIPMFLIFFSFFSLILLFLKRKNIFIKKSVLLLMLSFFMFYFFYFISWFQTLGGNCGLLVKVKFFLIMQIPILILSSIGINYFIKFLGCYKRKKRIFAYFILFLLLICSIIWFHKTYFSDDKIEDILFDSGTSLSTLYFLSDFVNSNIPKNCLMISVFPDFFPLARHKKVYVLDYLDMKDEFNSYSCKVLMYDPVCSEENNTVDECIQLKSLFSNVYKKQVYSEYGDSIEFYYIN